MLAEAFAWSDGVRVAGTNIYCDASRCPAEAVAFVSHARAPRLRGGAEVRLVTTERTRLLRAIEVAPRGQAKATLVTPFGRPFALGRLRLELLPSGHAPGAAQLYVEVDGQRVGYCGPLNPQPGRFAEPPQVRAAAALCIDAPLAPFARRLPPRAEAEAALLAAVTAALDTPGGGLTPVVLAPPLGAAADVVALLAGAGLRLRVHPRIAAWLDGYGRAGLPVRTPPGALERFRGSPPRGSVVVWPLEGRAAPAVQRLRNARLLAATGLALDPDAAARLRVDAAFALADHGDLPSLVAHARAADAGDVWLTRGYTEEVARAFTAAGVRAHPLEPHRRMEQMPLFPTI